MEYTVVIGNTIMELSKMVNDFLFCGWEPQGSVSYDPKLKVYMQAVVREKEDGAKEN